MSVRVGAHRDHMRLSQGGSMPPWIDGIAQIDTGSDTTVVDGPMLGEALRLFPKTGQVVMHGAAVASGEESARDAIALGVTLLDLKRTVYIPAAAVSHGIGDGFLVVLGRDVLAHCTLTYDGIRGRFSLTFER